MACFAALYFAEKKASFDFEPYEEALEEETGNEHGEE